MSGHCLAKLVMYRVEMPMSRSYTFSRWKYPPAPQRRTHNPQSDMKFLVNAFHVAKVPGLNHVRIHHLPDPKPHRKILVRFKQSV